jgi:hypothetical protein
MPLPAGLTTITVTGSFPSGGGAPLSGTVTFTPSTDLTGAAGHVIIRAAPVEASLDYTGAVSQVLVCTDNADLSPAGWTWTVTERIVGLGVRAYSVLLPAADGPTIDLSALVHVTPVTPPSGALLAVNNLSDVDSAPVSRTNLGLGPLATLSNPGGTTEFLRADLTWDVPTGGGGGVQLGGDLGGTDSDPLVISTSLTDPLPIDQGGTNAADAPGARTALGLGSAAVENVNTLAGTIAALGAQAAGSSGQVADAGHVHPATGVVLATAAASTVQPGTAYGTAGAVGTDLTYAREDHQHGTVALANSAPAATEGIGQAAAVGTASTPARADHVHPLATAGTPGASAVGDNAATGSATTFAASDHKHGREAFAAPAAATTYGLAAVTGSAATLAHSDHTHGTPGLTTTAPAATLGIGTAAALGAAALPALADHVHPVAGAATPTTSAVGDAAATGNATTFAASNHTHGREGFGGVTALSAFGTSSANGSATTISHSDHIHGAPALPTATTGAAGIVQLDGAAGDIAALGTQAAGAIGKAADAGHVHPTTGLVDTTSSQAVAGVKAFASPPTGPTPVGAGDLVNKAYADAIATGLAVKGSCRLATAAALPTNVYSNGASGVGATLTGVSVGVLTVDGLAVNAGDRIIVQNEAAAANDGIYACTVAGAAGAAYVLTRTADMNSAAQIPGAFAFTEAGNANAGAGFTVASPGPFTVGTTAIAWTQFSGAGEITAGTGLAKGGNTISLTTPVPVSLGGTGQTGAAAAYNALSPMTTLGDLEYESGANTAARLPGNTGAAKQFLTQTGTGSASAAPAWGAIATADLPAVTAVGIQPSGDTSGATDAAAILAAVNAAATAGGGAVTLGAGAFTVTKLTLKTGVRLVGAGRYATTVTLANGVNDNLIETTSFATLTGTDTTATPYAFAVEHLTLDGNKANQSAGTSHCLAIYGYGYRISSVIFRNARSWGLWTEWGSASNFLAPDGMEAFVSDIKIHDTDAGSLKLIGPHDTQFVNVIACKNSGTSTGASAVSIPTDGRANGAVFFGMHVYGGAYDYGLTVASSGLNFVGCQFEGALVAQTQILASINQMSECKWFWGSSGANTSKGVVLGDGTHTNINSVRLRGKVENTSGGVLDLTNAGGGNFYDVAAVFISPFTVPSPAVAGSFNAQDTVSLTVVNNAGAATADSFFQNPVLVKTPALTLGGASIPANTDSDPLGIGYATTHPWNATANGAAALFGANAALYQQLVGYGMSTNQLRFLVGTSSGNVSAGLYGNGGQSGSARLPGARQATTGAIPCPASGMATVTLTTTVTVGRSWYAALSCDNTTATFQRSAPNSSISNGVAANQGTAHPLPSTAGAANGGGTLLWMATT